MEYQPIKIEKKWQKEWEKQKLYQANDVSGKPKYYQLETFPYPSAAGLHVGHPKGYIAEDIHARYMRMKGKEVLYTMGWDAFGLPTENYAIKVGKSPQEVADANIKNFTKQLKMFGLSYDWSREINTSSPEYYKWTQWLFLQLHKKGLAYQTLAKVNWCPKDQTVLANEQVIDGRCERCGTETIQKEMKQWFFKITDYADRLIGDLDGLDWPEPTLKRQLDWIGKSEGAELEFSIAGSETKIKVFTTRPDTLFGATYLVLAPESKLVGELLSKVSNREEVEKYVEATSHKTELMRKEGEKEKTGVELKGVYAINPANKKEIPIWTADFVLGNYGTGAVFADAHDERDFDFAKKYNIPLKPTLKPADGGDDAKIRNLEECFTGYGILYNSGQFDGLDSETAKWEITKFVGGQRKTQYKLRDWSVSRQRYWGVPIPMVECEKCGTVPVPEDDLPVKLPKLDDYRPKGMPPLAGSEKFMNVKCPKCGGDARRVAETLDTFVDSSWYFLRYTDPHNDKEFASKEKLSIWMPIQLYVIGAEHTVLHLLYSRFITKFLSDEGYLNVKEPFLKLRHVGLIEGTDGQKMSKSRGNVINPDEVVERYGADTVRLYEMFMGPFEYGQPWDIKGVVGVSRFLNRVHGFWSAENNHQDQPHKIHKLIKKITEDIESFKFNTAIAAFMEYYQNTDISTNDWKTFLKLLAPFAPHLAEELWEKLGHKTSIHLEAWPEFDPKFLSEETVSIPVQINGKLRGTITVSPEASEEEVRQSAMSEENIKSHMTSDVKKVIYVKGRVINIIV